MSNLNGIPGCVAMPEDVCTIREIAGSEVMPDDVAKLDAVKKYSPSETIDDC